MIDIKHSRRAYCSQTTDEWLASVVPSCGLKMLAGDEWGERSGWGNQAMGGGGGGRVGREVDRINRRRRVDWGEWGDDGVGGGSIFQD